MGGGVVLENEDLPAAAAAEAEGQRHRPGLRILVVLVVEVVEVANFHNPVDLRSEDPQ